MTPFKDQSIGLVEQSTNIKTSAPSSMTILYDDQRQGVEISLVNHFLKSTKVYISSKGIVRSQVNDSIVPELDTRDLGQQINTRDFSFFEDRTERVQADAIIASGLIQEDNAVDFNYLDQDGVVVVFSDTGKRIIYQSTEISNKRGISSTAVSLPLKDTYYFKDNSIYAFQDGVETRLGIPIEGYESIIGDISPYIEEDTLNGLNLKIEYGSIAINEKVPTAGFAFYGTEFGTDSVAFGGRLR